MNRKNAGALNPLVCETSAACTLEHVKAVTALLNEIRSSAGAKREKTRAWVFSGSMRQFVQLADTEIAIWIRGECLWPEESLFSKA